MIILVGDDSRPAYKRLAHGLRAAISDGTYRTGQIAFTAADLAEQLGMSRSTVDEALHRIAREHLMVSTVGRGWQVTPEGPRLAPLMLAIDALDEEVCRAGAELTGGVRMSALRAIVDDLAQAVEGVRAVAVTVTRK